MVTPHVNEEYQCTNCECTYTFLEVQFDWLCLKCNRPISIKYNIQDREYCCKRIFPSELKTGDLITSQGQFINQILSIRNEGTHFRVNLKEYGALNLPVAERVMKIDGSWYPIILTPIK